jgi:Fic family protein
MQLARVDGSAQRFYSMSAMIRKLFEGFEGKLTSSKWAQIMKCSQDTALRDILELVEKGILFKDSAGGRSTSYFLKDL